jgi:hypothetical protein
MMDNLHMNKNSMVTLILVSLWVSGCSQLYPQFSPTETVEITSTPSPAPTTQADTSNCFYVEASSDMPAAANLVQSTLKSDKIDVVNTAARGDGKNYICPEAGTSNFSSSQTSLTITLKVDTLDDVDALGNLTGKVLDNLTGLSQTVVPHWQDGQIQINFTSGSDSRNLVFPAAYGIDKRGQGLDGPSLWQALNNQPCTTQTNQDSDMDLSVQIQAALKKAGISNANVTVTVEGIQCVNPQNGSIESYSAQKTTFNFNLYVSSTNDQQAIGNSATQALAALSGINKADIPGTQPAVILFNFNDGSQQESFSIGYLQAINAYQSGFNGTKLFNLLTSHS